MSRKSGGRSIFGPAAAMVIVVVLPLTQLLIEQVNVIGDALPIQQLIQVKWAKANHTGVVSFLSSLE